MRRMLATAAEDAMKLFSRKRASVIAGEVRELTTQFHTTLRANFARTRKVDGKLDQADAEHLKALLDPKEPHSWNEAYEAEQLLVDTFDDQTLETECAVRSLEADKTLSPQLAAFYAEHVKEAKTAKERQGLLARLVNDLQWRYTVNEVKRRYETDITRRTGWFFAIALGAFGLAIALIAHYNVKFVDSVLLGVAALAGTWGATFSMLASLKGRLRGSELDDMKLMRPRVMLLSRALIGTGAGCVLYFLVRSGLLAGAAFPKFEVFGTPKFDEGQFALLIVWCFIAGFSEKLVPSLLEKSEARANIGAPDSDRFRPGPDSGGSGSASTGSGGAAKTQKGRTGGAGDAAATAAAVTAGDGR
jgi:hypothetical protein